MNYPETTLSDLLEHSVGQFSNRKALVYSDTNLTYTDLLDQVNRTAGALQALGLKTGDRVALMLPNSPEFVIAYFGVLRAGGIVTATSPIYTAREAAHQWKDAGAVICIMDCHLQELASEVRPLCPALRHFVLVRRQGDKSDPVSAVQSVDWEDLLNTSPPPAPTKISPEDVACLQYTGGTTGVSKGAMLTHRNLVVNVLQTGNALGVDGQTPEIVVAVLPFFHVYAMTCAMLMPLATGGIIIILPRFELAPTLRLIRRHRPTIFFGVPTMYVALAGASGLNPDDFRSLRICMAGGAPLPGNVRCRFEELTGSRLVEGYGLSETSPVALLNPPGKSRAGSIGLPVVDTEARIVDVETGTREMPNGESGEILLRGPQVMKGYWNNPEETAQAMAGGWFHTGDIATRDKDGYFFILDRKKDMIIASGYNVYPREVEEVLFSHPKVKEAVVIGVTDTYRGETVKAFIVAKEGPPPTSDEIIAHCRGQLASYKVPRLIEFRESLPKSGVGKYLRRALRQPAGATTASPESSPSPTTSA